MAAPVPYESSQASIWIRAAAASLCHSHANTGSEPHLQTPPQLAATRDPSPTEQGQGSNPNPPRDNVRPSIPWVTMGTPRKLTILQCLKMEKKNQTMENSMEARQTIKLRIIIWSIHSWVYTRKKWEQGLERHLQTWELDWELHDWQ